VKRRRLGPKALLLGFDRDVYCRKCGQIDKVKTREEALFAARTHLVAVTLRKRAKKMLKQRKLAA
jgi:hypothetical protein